MKDLLIVVDMQEGFRGAASESIVPNVKKLIQAIKGDVIFLCFRNESGSMFEKQLKWKKFQNKNDQELLGELDSPNYRRIFHKNYTIFDKKITGIIKRGKFRNVYLCGIYTDVCIIKAAMDAFDSKIDVKIIHDACNSLHGEDNHRLAIDSMKHIIGKTNVISVNDVIK